MHRNANKLHRRSVVYTRKLSSDAYQDLVQLLDDQWPPKTTRRRRKRFHHIVWDAVHQETQSLVSGLMLRGECVVGDLVARFQNDPEADRKPIKAILDGRHPFSA